MKNPSVPSPRPAVAAAALDVAAPQGAVSWPAIFAGAAAATATTAVLVILGAGIGLGTASADGATTVAVGGMVWLIVTQWISSGLGGYLAGRLRTRWTNVHADETFFRDTAHGLVAWSIATVLTLAVVASATTSLVGAGARAIGGVAAPAIEGATAAGTASASTSTADPGAALVDVLFRPAQVSATGGDAADAKREAAGILAASVAKGELAPADRTYLAQLAAARTGIPQAEAEQRVDTMVANAKAAADAARTAADEARKAAASVALFTALSMVVGAFIAAVAAALGGRLRDT